MQEIKITKENFEKEVLASPVPVLLDFYADWCGPCRMVAPLLTEIAAEKDGEVRVCKVNVDEVPELADRFSVSSIPTLLIFKNGVQTAAAVGYHPKADILRLLEQ